MKIEAWDEVYGAKSQEKLQTFLERTTDSYAILQLKLVDETAQDRFMNYSWLEKHGREPEIDHYEVTYVGELPAHSSQDVLLEGLYEQFNLARPEDFRGHSLSVSDIVALRQNGVVSSHYVDSIGFREVPGFIRPESYLKNAEMAMEDDYDMVGDGIINNGRRDERPSVLEQLKELRESRVPELPKRSAKDISDREL